MSVKRKAAQDASTLKNEIILDPVARTVTIKNLVIKSDELFSFLEDKKDREDALRKALVVGALGIRSMGTDMKIDYVDKKFSQFLAEIEKKFSEQHAAVTGLFDPANPESPVGQLHRRINETFDEKNTDSPMFRLARQLENYFDDQNGVVRNIINRTFNLRDLDSPMGRFMKEIDMYFNKDSGQIRQLFEKSFDLNNPATPFGQMMFNMDNYFRDDGKISKMLNEHFDMDDKKSSMSQFADMLATNFDVDKGTIRHLLDPARPGSPVNMLKEEMLRNFNDVREKLSAARAEQAMMEKSTQKGGVFEDAVYEQLHAITTPHGDSVDAVGTVTGLTGKTGDFIVMLSDHKERIVVEAKDSAGYTIPKTIDEIQSAIENRKAVYGIFLFKSLDQMPRALQPCRIERNYIITSMDGGGLYYAYHVAKTVLRSERMKNGGSIPVDKIQAEVEFLVKKSLVIEEAIRKARKINEHVDSVESTLRTLQSEIDDSLRRIQNFLKNS